MEIFKKSILIKNSQKFLFYQNILLYTGSLKIYPKILLQNIFYLNLNKNITPEISIEIFKKFIEQFFMKENDHYNAYFFFGAD